VVCVLPLLLLACCLMPDEITEDFCSSPVFVGIWTWMRVEMH
jgi:hypothetical protein